MTNVRSLLAAALLFSAAPAFGQALTPAETAKVDALVTETLASTGTPSASIAIVRGGAIVYAKAYGKQSETLTVAKEDAPYQIASISKQFAAAAVLLLADEGQLRLDDAVGKYVTGITNGNRITIRQVLSHTSGLQDYWPQDYAFKAMATPVSPQSILDGWAMKALDFEPGTAWQYSNTGYVVAGLIVEKVSGMPLIDFLNARIFKPLAITAYDQDLAVGPNFPQGYGRHALGPVRPEPPAANGWLYAAGELSMSARDLAKWDIARINRSVLKPADWAAQETAIKLADGTDTHYGLGVSIRDLGGRRMIEHNGEAVGFISENMVFPDEKAAFVVLTNTWSSSAASSIANSLVPMLLPPAPVSAADQAAADKARLVLDQLRAGTLDRSLLTDNANYYFTPVALADYRESLAPLGEPVSITATGPARLRGGFVLRSYRIKYADRTLNLSTFFEPGDRGRIEQFLITPIG
jgi:CubicO group peptidase (beta-lactamase class C family)